MPPLWFDEIQDLETARVGLSPIVFFAIPRALLLML